VEIAAINANGLGTGMDYATQKPEALQKKLLSS
jgi:hypothetical protein